MLEEISSPILEPIRIASESVKLSSKDTKISLSVKFLIKKLVATEEKTNASTPLTVFV